MKVYISGPMRGKPDFNYGAFNEVEAAIRETRSVFPPDVEVMNPARNFGGDQTRDTTEYLTVDLSQVLAADAVVLLPDWRNSEGAKLEVRVAVATGKRFYESQKINVGTDGSTDMVWGFREASVPGEVIDASARAAVLTEATQLITGDRNNAYGPPTQDFDRTAAMASAFGFQVNGQPLAAHHVAIFMILLKTSRLAWTPAKRDSWVDAAGYAGCGYECAVESEKRVA